ncbi:hypothetical protein GCM10023116_27970 [Kistimonas scapharcae]|uniref:Uncharacterized protein n=1 Tax=Kistimonas scapharcae TaxID=1036133 RepID=A0ABP8V3B1_9GAMM
MVGLMLALVGVALFVCALRAHLQKKVVGSVKPSQAKQGMVVSVLLLVGGLWMAVPDGPSHGDAVTSVLMTIPDSESSVNKYLTGDLDDGVAVVVNGSAGYWVKDGKVFAVNGVASNMSPGIQYSPNSVNWSSVENAVK